MKNHIIARKNEPLKLNNLLELICYLTEKMASSVCVKLNTAKNNFVWIKQ